MALKQLLINYFRGAFIRDDVLRKGIQSKRNLGQTETLQPLYLFYPSQMPQVFVPGFGESLNLKFLRLDPQPQGA